MTDELQRAVVYTPQPGDVVVLEVPARLTLQELDRLTAQARLTFGLDVKVIALAGARFAGVVRPE